MRVGLFAPSHHPLALHTFYHRTIKASHQQSSWLPSGAGLGDDASFSPAEEDSTGPDQQIV